MTATTRRRLTVCLVLGLVTLPAEALLLPVVRARTPREAALAWARDLAVSDVQNAVARIEDYPYLYRRALMEVLTPTDRSNVWRSHLRQYMTAHPELTPAQVGLIQDMSDAASPDVFVSTASQASKDRIASIFNDAKSLLGPVATGELFITLGPKNVSNTASLLPWSERLGNFVRSWQLFAVEEGPNDCNCSMTFDTCDLEPDPWLVCSELYSCEADTTWPMCGPLWCWACNGWCKVLRIE
jgi:hypothetical protein